MYKTLDEKVFNYIHLVLVNFYQTKAHNVRFYAFQNQDL
jgi:hypothetical protein